MAACAGAEARDNSWESISRPASTYARRIRTPTRWASTRCAPRYGVNSGGSKAARGRPAGAAGGGQSVLHLARVIELTVGDGHHNGLHRCQPHRESAGIVLDQDPEKALDGAVECAMHHQRLVRLAVLGDVFQAEPAGQGEIEL